MENMNIIKIPDYVVNSGEAARLVEGMRHAYNRNDHISLRYFIGNFLEQHLNVAISNAIARMYPAMDDHSLVKDSVIAFIHSFRGKDTEVVVDPTFETVAYIINEALESLLYGEGIERQSEDSLLKFISFAQEDLPFREELRIRSFLHISAEEELRRQEAA